MLKIISLIILIAISYSCKTKEISISKEKALTIAKDYAVKLNVATTFKTVKIEKVDLKNLYNSYPELKEWDFFKKNHENKLIEKTFWTVSYKPENISIGGSLWVFIDVSTGIVLTAVGTE